MELLRNAGKKIPLFTEVLKNEPFNSIKHSQRFGHTDSEVNP